MIYCTTIEIDGISTDVAVDVENRFGQSVIVGMADTEGNAIAPDLLDPKIEAELNNRIVTELF